MSPIEWIDTGWVSVGSMVQYAGEVLSRGHALFGEPPVAADPSPGGSQLAQARDLVGSGRHRAATLTGALPAGYATFAADAGITLAGLAHADDQLGTGVRHAAAADRSGRTTSGHVLDTAAADTARMSPLSGTPAGQRTLVKALRDKIFEQQRVVAAYQMRDARMAAALRSLDYPPGAGIGGATAAPYGGTDTMPLGGTRGARSPSPSSDGSAAPRTRTVGWGAILGDPARNAVDAALGKRGRPYAWGAKGPNVFDCSGLTQWAWRQAGVQLGGDTYAQIRDGVPVSPDQVRAGDLIFPLSSFGEGGRPGPGHVMLAISPTEAVHAPHTGDVVRVAPLPSRFVARRPVPVLMV